jgi:hypothetical protein
MPDPSKPCGRATPETASCVFQGRPAAVFYPFRYTMQYAYDSFRFVPWEVLIGNHKAWYLHSLTFSSQLRNVRVAALHAYLMEWIDRWMDGS